jgi:hypothetical protein
MTTLSISVEDRVRAIAHSLWLEEGMPEGRAESHWFKALELVNAEAAEAPRSVAPKSAAPKAPAKPKAKAPAAAAKKAAPKSRTKA